jgi:hypothetical protein
MKSKSRRGFARITRIKKGKQFLYQGRQNYLSKRDYSIRFLHGGATMLLRAKGLAWWGVWHSTCYIDLLVAAWNELPQQASLIEFI